MATHDFEVAIRGTNDYKKNKLSIKFNDTQNNHDNVKLFRIINNVIKIEFNKNACNRVSVEYLITNSTKINGIMAGDFDVGAPSSDCYLTTVCVDYKGLPDDCYELETLRKFRDEYLLVDSLYKDSVLDYYEFAPKLVKKISDKEDVLEDTYQSLVLPCVRLIEKNKYKEAFELYKDYTLKLKNTYLT